MCLKNNIIKFIAFCLNKPLIVLVDFDRECTLTIGEYTETGLFAHRWLFTKVAKVRLMPNNKTKGVSYVERWYYYRGAKC